MRSSLTVVFLDVSLIITLMLSPSIWLRHIIIVVTRTITMIIITTQQWFDERSVGS